LVVCEALIPADVGGWDIREAGIFDANGVLLAVGKYPMITKPAPGSGAARAEYVRGGFRVSNGGNTVLTMDNSLVMATQAYVDAHAALTSPHSATSLGTANRLLVRDAQGRAQVAAPAAAADIATKAVVDAGDAGTLAVIAAHAGAAAPHAGHVNHNLSTAINDFLVGSGIGTWIKKTAGEVQVLLGLGQLSPPGMIAPFATVFAPSGWILCSGQAVLRATYPALFIAIGTYYGAGDGVTTFNLPDLRGQFVRGADVGRGIDPGRTIGSDQADAFKAHTHTYAPGAQINAVNTSASSPYLIPGGSTPTGST
jgi:phage-related tail fiber protein